MPIRENYSPYATSTGQSALHGLAEGLQQGIAPWIQEIFRERASDRIAKRELQAKVATDALNDYRAGNISDQQYTAITGGKPPTPLAPTSEQLIGKLNEKFGANTTPEEANVRTHAFGPLRHIPDIPEGTFNVARPNEPSALMHPDIPADIESPESGVTQKLTNLLQAKNEEPFLSEKPTKIGETADVTPGFGQQSEETTTGNVPSFPLGGDITPMSVLGKFNPRSQQMQETGRVPSGPSAVTKGRAAGLEAEAGAPGKGRAEAAVFNALTPPTLAREAGQQQQHIDIETNPANVQKEAGRQYTMAYNTKRAQDAAEEAGVPTEITKSYLRSTSIPDHNYVHFPPGTPPAEQRVVKRILTQALDGKVSFVTQQENAALSSIETARSNYQNIVDLLINKVAKTYKGNILTAPRNIIEGLLKSDPELVAATTAFGQKVQGLRAQAGQFGRITQTEIFRALDQFPQPTDPMDVILSKRAIFARSLENAERPLFGR